MIKRLSIALLPLCLLGFLVVVALESSKPFWENNTYFYGMRIFIPMCLFLSIVMVALNRESKVRRRLTAMAVVALALIGFISLFIERISQ